MVYENVPREIHESMIFAESIGGFFQDHIEGAYRAQEVGRKPRGRRR